MSDTPSGGVTDVETVNRNPMQAWKTDVKQTQNDSTTIYLLNAALSVLLVSSLLDRGLILQHSD